jgi:ribonuclease BN (tRNA processing enzyme)
MRLTILGSGTVVPDGSRNSAGFFVEMSGVGLMMDCGAGTVHALARYGMPWQHMSHLFISHFHVDHIGELASLFFAFRWGMEIERTEPLTVIGPQGLDGVMAKLDEALGPKLFEPRFPVNLKLLAPGESIRFDSGATLSVAKTPHTNESLAVRIDSNGKSICYTGDTGFSEELADFFAGADILISECSFEYRRAGVPHLAIDDVSAMATRAGVSRLIVTHFYFRFIEDALIEKIQKGYSGMVIVGRDGLQFEV